MNGSRILVAAIVLTSAALSSGVAKFQKDFTSSYALKKDGKLSKATCAVCHVGKTAKLNPYGVDLKKAMGQENTKLLTGSVLKKVEGLDSDKDGVPNVKEIDADTLPGDPKSK